VPVAGTLVIDDCPGGRDVPLLHIHGAADDNVPVAGGIGARAIAEIDYRPLTETFSLLAVARGCSDPTVRLDELGAEETRYECAAGAPIVVKILPDVGHTWPGARARPLQRNRYDGAFSASEAAWEFARHYTR
jgi:polyhydroxybutyrate depolymerase